MANIQATDREGNKMHLAEVDGHRYPIFPLETLKNIPNTQARPDDVLLCTYPKSGSHWISLITHYLLTLSTEESPDTDKADSMIERVTSSDLNDLPSPRNLNTHCHFDTLSPGFFRQRSKIIYVTRDPRDVAVSFFNHHKKLLPYYGYNGEWKDYFHFFMDGEVDYESWFDYTKGWEKGIQEHPDHPFLVLSYEAMKQNPMKEIAKMADFLGAQCSEDFLEQVVNNCSFNAMKKNAKPDNPLSINMFRKGEVGDWKNWFTVAQSELFNEVFEKEMPGTNAYKLYSHTVQSQADAGL